MPALWIKIRDKGRCKTEKDPFGQLSGPAQVVAIGTLLICCYCSGGLKIGAVCCVHRNPLLNTIEHTVSNICFYTWIISNVLSNVNRKR